MRFLKLFSQDSSDNEKWLPSQHTILKTLKWESNNPHLALSSTILMNFPKTLNAKDTFQNLYIQTIYDPILE